MKKQISLGLLFTTLGCAPERPIGTQVHEGPVASPSEACFAAFDAEDRLAWVHPDGTRAEGPAMGPSMGPVRAMAYDRARDGLVVTTSEEIVFVPSGARSSEEWAEERESSEGTRAAWPTADGVLFEGELGAWTHRDSSGGETRRILPQALSFWERPAAGVVEWLGAGHPRRPGLMLIRGDAQAPLAAPELVEELVEELVDELDIAPGTQDLRAAPGPNGAIIFAHIANSKLQISGRYGGELLPIEAPFAAQHLSSVVWLGSADYIFSAEEPESVFRMDLETSNIEHLEGLRGPVAGPVPCRAMNSLP